jgi:hypothetical protein
VPILSHGPFKFFGIRSQDLGCRIPQVATRETDLGDKVLESNLLAIGLSKSWPTTGTIKVWNKFPLA